MKKQITFIIRILLPLAVMLMAMQVQAASRTVNFSDIMIDPGGTAEMVVSYETDYTDLTALQIDFVLPDGITLADAHAGGSLSQACPNLYFSFNPKRDDGKTVVMCYNLSGTLPTGKQEAFVLKFQADKDAAKRTYGIETARLEFTHKGSSASDLLDNKTFFITVKKPYISTMRGDVNNDRGISLTDVLMMVDYILDNPSDDFLTSNADFNGDGDVSIADILMLVNIILGNPDGISFKWYLIANSADGQSQPIALDEIGSLAASGSAYDFAILDNSGNTILENVTRVEFKYEYELEASGYTVPSGMPAAYLFRPMQARLYAASEQGGNRFLVADRNGNNLFARGVTFQHVVDGTTWTAGGSEGEIDDLQFISRANTQMVTGSSDDIIQMLKELSGTDQADAEAIASTIEMNENVEEAYSADGSNVIVKMEGDDNYVVYPMYSIGSVFSEEGDVEVFQDMSNARKKVNAPKLTSQKERVAIFNFFEGGFGGPDDQKSAFSSFIKGMFEDSQYEVEYYGHGFDNDGVPTFTTERLDFVISHSSDYKAIIIMSHGCETKEGYTYFATCERCQKGKEYNYVISIDGGYFVPHSSNMYLDSNCLLYLGPCHGIPQKGYSFPTNTVLGWQGINSVSQIHAAVFFHKLLYNSKEQVSVERAWQSTFQKDPFHPSTQLYKSDNLFDWGGVSNPKVQQDHANDITAVVKVGNPESGEENSELGKDKFIKYTGKQQKATISGYVSGKWDNRGSIVKLRLEPILRIQRNGESSYIVPNAQGAFLSDLGGGVKSFSAEFTLKDRILEGIYRVNVYVQEETNTSWKLVEQPNPVYVIYSSKLPDNYALPEASDEDCYMPSVLDSDGQPVEEITIPAGTSRTYQLDAWSGHTFDTPCLDTDVAAVSLSGKTLTVTGVSEGSTVFGVFDRQNHKMAVVNVTVTPGGSLPSYLACPDDHHPHLIDLGLPSGTKWACCNEGASKPEEYGGYYTFAQVSTAPSIDQIVELLDNCSNTWTTLNGVNGRNFIGPNGSTIFLPAAGSILGVLEPYDVGTRGRYWSSTPITATPYAFWLYIDSGDAKLDEDGYRGNKFSVRSVR